MSASKGLITFICMWLAWILFTGSIALQDLAVGAISACLVSIVSYKLFSRGPVSKRLDPRKWFYLIAYIPVYIWAEIKSHIIVAYWILHPKLPIRPAIVRLNSNLESDVGLTTLANSITMTPGTLSVDVKESDIYVHWISAESLEDNIVYEKIGKPFERFLKGGLE